MTRRHPALALLILLTVAAAVVTSPVGAAGAAPDVAAGTSTVTVDVDGTPRQAVVHVPAAVAAAPDQAVPLVLHLHGGLGSPEHSIATTGIVEAADAHGFVAVFPRGTAVRLRLPDGATGHVWNAGRCCGVAARKDVDDVAFLRALVAELEATLPVDPDRVVMSGHSNGAMMTWRFACETAGVLAAAMPVAGSLETADPEACEPGTTSLLAVHGDADRNHPIDGGTGDRSVSRVAYRPFADSVAAYARAAGCRAAARTSHHDVETESRYHGCASGASVQAVVLAGAEHPWPGGTAGGTAGRARPFPDWSATETLVTLVDETA